ncbi:hypothetical protein DCS_00156 [Drechmeria coniospora]|uniref:Presequence translocated-associated motor subunit PAM17 n=1 Tax=Drechmeria coniospora TaxID=98403 RepID=A0A151GPJ4_DRECN|nr:hypothetical protein DCS_00156 [Drechmeria coniospora]KYK59029.1 hypothetical protein DCS_00156 [Drechmeria coniospora]ODA77792.1 hypothetical protein RJ55_06394 [Drechmeria coniospora]
MAASLKTLAVRWHSSAQGIVRCCPKPMQALSTTTRSACHLARAPRQALFRSNHSIAAVEPPRAVAGIGHASRCFSSATAASQTAHSPVAAAAASASSSPSSSSPSPAKLDWNSFFKLRLRRRRIQLVFSVTTGLFGGAAGALALSTGVAEPVVMQIPLDPFVTLGLITFACAGMGWLVGPSIGNQVFYIMNRRLKSQMMAKESEFFARVKKHRVDPTNSSAGNPVPDFYGEKIQSVSGYRRWLKDQRAFNKKKTANFV